MNERPVPPTRVHPGMSDRYWWWDEYDHDDDPMHDPSWDRTWVEDDRADWEREPEMQKCMGSENFLGDRVHCDGDVIGPHGLCAECEAEDGYTSICRHCGLNRAAYFGPPTCRTCYQWLRRNGQKYADDEELAEQLARVVARRRRKVGRPETLDE